MHGTLSRLKQELDCWADQSLTARLWVRDDDAQELSEPLSRLRVMVQDYKITIGLAVIPGLLRAELLDFLAGAKQEFFPMCHGWKHINHGSEERPSEFGSDRPLSSLLSEADLAYQKFVEFFGRTKVIFVPPYNRIDRALIAALPSLGYAGVSLGASSLETRLARLAEKIWLPAIKLPGHSTVAWLNAQIDLMDWKRRTAQDTELIGAKLIGHLRLRRRGLIRAEFPIGLLTHHLAHDDDVWRLCNDVLDCLRGHGAVDFFDVGKEVEQSRRCTILD
jgi:hypothetical protein